MIVQRSAEVVSGNVVTTATGENTMSVAAFILFEAMSSVQELSSSKGMSDTITGVRMIADARAFDS